jgi:hypothetical protein
MDAINRPVRTLSSDGKAVINKALLYERLGQHTGKQAKSLIIAQGDNLFKNLDTKQSSDAMRRPNESFSNLEWQYDDSVAFTGFKRGYYRLCSEPGFHKLLTSNEHSMYLGYALYNPGGHGVQSILHQANLGLLVNQFSITMNLSTGKISPLIIEDKKQDALISYSKGPIYVSVVTPVENEVGDKGTEVLWFRW